MKTSTRPREVGGSFASRRGHVQQLSISDSNHHVTEAIGDMYGDDDYSKRESRPLSYQTSPLNEGMEANRSYFEIKDDSRPRPPPTTNGYVGRRAQTSPAMMQSTMAGNMENGQISPSLSLREHTTSDTANAPFPLNDIDYESNPAAVAQELSNLQALRRMSMDIANTSDPDLPSFQGASIMPTVAPTGDDNEEDPSRLFWVPARVHPELAPMEFKSFLEKRVQTIKRRSGEQASLSPDGIDRSGSDGGLRRKKSMLSKQIDNSGGRGALGYTDGAEQLERKGSLSSNTPDLKIADLQGLDALVRDPAKAVRKLSLDTSSGQGGQSTADEDMPILPQAPGIGLRRSTRTTYRRGSLRKGERVPFSKRAGSLRQEKDGDESPISPTDGRAAGFPLTKVQSDPACAENFSRPNRGARRMPAMQHLNTQAKNAEAQSEDLDDAEHKTSAMSSEEPSSPSLSDSPRQAQPSQSISRTNTFPRNDVPVPKIVETPPPTETAVQSTRPEQPAQFPARSSSQKSTTSQQIPSVTSAPAPEPPARSTKRPLAERQQPASSQPIVRPPQPNQTLKDMAQHPSPLPGNSARTDSLTFIPTLEEKKQPEKKSKKDKDDGESSGSKKAGWGWFKGSDEKDKKDKKKHEEEHKDGKKGKAKAAIEKIHDSARLDVLQATMEAATVKGRESLVLDRDNVDSKLQDERKKESNRKTGEIKKEKDGIFSSIFGSSKKKAERNSGDKKGNSLRTLSPDPPHRMMRADIDYNWTRFSILEERAIYRMAHIKLANPRRALYSQVLLSNFMYSYLAKVQQMHPQMQMPQTIQQKRAEAERRQEELQNQQQPQQAPEGTDPYQFDYHQDNQQVETSPRHAAEGSVPYIDDSQIYSHDHQGDESVHGHEPTRPQSRTAQSSPHDYNQNLAYQDDKGYYYGDQRADGDEEDDMW